jgi:hypothetical protein
VERGSLEAWAQVSLVSEVGVGVEGSVTLGVTPGRLESNEGTIEVLASTYQLGAVAELGKRGRGVFPRLGAGISFAHLSVSGSANAPFQGVDRSVRAFGPWIGADLVWRATSHLSLALGAQTAYYAPQIVIRSAGRPIATWGRPTVGVRLGLQWSWR